MRTEFHKLPLHVLTPERPDGDTERDDDHDEQEEDARPDADVEGVFRHAVVLGSLQLRRRIDDRTDAGRLPDRLHAPVPGHKPREYFPREWQLSDFDERAGEDN